MSDSNGDASAPPPSDGQEQSRSARPGRRPETTSSRAIAFLSQNYVTTAIYLTRVATVLFTFYYLVFSSSDDSRSAYSRIFLSAAASNALRLQQQLGRFAFTREFFDTVLMEDAAHYLGYCLAFLATSPVTMAITPVFLFALMHSVNFTGRILGLDMGYHRGSLPHKVYKTFEDNTSQMLSFIACSEIFLAPIVFSMIFTGKAGLFLPFVYYRFLTLRYKSRRNPATKEAFAQMRIALSQVADYNSTPQIVRSFILNSIDFISRLSPQTANT